MREFPGDAFANAFVGVDGVYQTRGFTAMHGACILRCIQFWGTLLAFHCMSRNHLEDPFVSTSCSMERYGLNIILKALHKEGLGKKSLKFLADHDIKIALAVKKFWREVLMRICSGHLNKNLGIAIMDKAGKKMMDGISEEKVYFLFSVVHAACMH